MVHRKTKSEIRAAACLLRSRNWRHLENSDVSEQNCLQSRAKLPEIKVEDANEVVKNAIRKQTDTIF